MIRKLAFRCSVFIPALIVFIAGQTWPQAFVPLPEGVLLNGTQAMSRFESLFDEGEARNAMLAQGWTPTDTIIVKSYGRNVKKPRSGMQILIDLISRPVSAQAPDVSAYMAQGEFHMWEGYTGNPNIYAGWNSQWCYQDCGVSYPGWGAGYPIAINISDPNGPTLASAPYATGLEGEFVSCVAAGCLGGPIVACLPAALIGAGIGWGTCMSSVCLGGIATCGIYTLFQYAQNAGGHALHREP